MRIVHLASATALVLTLAGAAPVHAQSFLDGLARRAADRVVGEASRRAEGAVAGVLSGTRDEGADASEAEPSSPREPAARRAPAASPRRSAAPSGPAPWPRNADAAVYTGDLEFDPADEARVKALEEFGKSRCSGCEAGYAYDTFITYYTDSSVDQVAARVGAMSVGESFTWRGEVATGRLEVLSEAPVGTFPCKQVRVSLTNGQESRETPGLYCLGKSHQYAREMWVRAL